MQISDQILSMQDDCVRIRRDLHRIPEIGFRLYDTQAYVRKELEACGPDSLETLALTGLKAVFYAKGAEKTLAFRADMDALRSEETNDVPYRSCREGAMHGCGHDGHTTILLLLAKWIAKNRKKLRCNLRAA